MSHRYIYLSLYCSLTVVFFSVSVSQLRNCIYCSHRRCTCLRHLADLTRNSDLAFEQISLPFPTTHRTLRAASEIKSFYPISASDSQSYNSKARKFREQWGTFIPEAIYFTKNWMYDIYLFVHYVGMITNSLLSLKTNLTYNCGGGSPSRLAINESRSFRGLAINESWLFWPSLAHHSHLSGSIWIPRQKNDSSFEATNELTHFLVSS